MRAIERATRSCGGQVVEIEPSEADAEMASTRCTCCLRVLQCNKCAIKFVLTLEAPEVDYRD